MIIKHAVISNSSYSSICVDDLRVGQIGVVEYSTGSFNLGDHIMAIYGDRLVCLNEPHTTWTRDGQTARVVLVRPGTVLTLVVGG